MHNELQICNITYNRSLCTCVCAHACTCVCFSFLPSLNLAIHLLSLFTHHNIHKLFPLLVFKNQTSRKRVNISSIILIINECNVLGKVPNLTQIPPSPPLLFALLSLFLKNLVAFHVHVHHYRLQRGELLSYFHLYLTWTSV